MRKILDLFRPAEKGSPPVDSSVQRSLSPKYASLRDVFPSESRDYIIVEELNKTGFSITKTIKEGVAYIAEKKETIFLKKAGDEAENYKYPEIYDIWEKKISRALILPKYHGIVKGFHIFEYVSGKQFDWSESPSGKGYGGEGIPLSTVPTIIDLALDVSDLGVQADFYWRNFIFTEQKICVVDWDQRNLSIKVTVDSLLAYIYLLMFKNRAWQIDLIRFGKSKDVLNSASFRAAVISWAVKYINQYKNNPTVSAEIKRIMNVFKSDKGFEALWRGIDLLSLLDGVKYHVFEELGQTREFSSQIECSPKLMAIRLDRIDLSGKRVLDVGCSSGWFMNEFLNRGAGEVIGVDVVKSNCRLAEEILTGAYQWSNIKVIHSDILDMELSDEIDVVASISMFHYIERKQEFFNKIYASLRSGGVFILEVPIHEGVEDVMVKNLTPKRYIPSLRFVDELANNAGFSKEYFGRSNLEERRVFHFRRP